MGRMYRSARVVAVVFIAAIAASSDAQPHLVGAQPIKPSVEAPEFEISNLRISRDRFGRPMLVADYKRVRAGKGYVRLAGRTRGGALRITNFGGSRGYNQPTGVIELSFVGAGRGDFDYELFFVVSTSWAGQQFPNMMVSNAARIGNPGAATQPRDWNREEKAAYEKNKLKDVPPKALPDGYVAIDAKTPVAAGMPVKAAWYGDWVDAEYLGQGPEGKVSVRYAKKDRATTLPRDRWVAVSPTIIDEVSADPSAFSPSMRVLPGGSLPLPTDAVALPTDTRLPPGTPVLRPAGSKWQTYYVVKDFGTDTVKVILPSTRDFHGRHAPGTYNPNRLAQGFKRVGLAIRKEVLEQLASPEAADAFAVNLRPHAGDQPLSLEDLGVLEEDKITVNLKKTYEGGGSDSYSITDRDYPIDKPIPADHQIVPAGVKLPLEARVFYNWGGGWKPAIVFGDRGKLVIVMEDDNHWVFANRIARSQLIISNRELRRVQQPPGSLRADLQKKLRTWTDSTGEFKVEARFVSKNGDKVTIKTDSGREITLPLKRLSDEDQELLADVRNEADNPFAP